MKKFISMAVVLAMVLSVVPMFGVALAEGADDMIVLFDIAQQNIVENNGDATALSNFGWTASGDATQGSNSNLRFSLHWTDDGEISGNSRKALTVFDSANDSTGRTVVASINSANDTASAEKLVIEYSWGIRSDKSDNYQSWTFNDIDGNVIAKTYIDSGTGTNEGGGNANFKLGKDENHAVVAQGAGSRDKVLALRAIPFKVEAVKQSDGTYVTTYYYDDDKDGEYTELYSENVGVINGFKSVSTWIGGWCNQWAAMGLMDLKISYSVDSAAEVTVKTVLSDNTPSGVEDEVKTVRAGAEYEQAVPANKVINVDGVYYIYNENASTRTIIPKAGEDNVITLVYDKFEGTGFTGEVIAEEGATCWFADPRSLTVKNDDINITYIGYIDNHGSVKATQYNHNTEEINEVLVRSNFQPDDHNNPTFLELPDHRIMIFYSRHTDEACFYYRISKQPYDITTLGDEKHLATKNNTTYPNPFILSDDPDHIYLGWRGIGWHPTLGKLTMPDENDNVTILLEKQIVQSTGARPYAKYTSNGKDEIWVTYTTGHPDNEDPNWLYFNRININTLDVMDVNGNKLSNVDAGTLAVNKTSDASRAFAVDTPNGGTRDWVWEIANDNGNPVIAMVKISGNKQSHDYWYAYYNGSEWVKTDLPDDPTINTFFHQTPGTENCYSGGMTIDKANPHDVYVSMPVSGVFGNVFEIVKFTLSDDYRTVINTEYITENSRENNVRPYISNGSEEGDMRLTWMNGQYYFWINDTRWGGKGFPTRMVTSFDIPEQPVANTLGAVDESVYVIDGNAATVPAPSGKEFTISMELNQSDISVGGMLLKSGNLEINLEKQSSDPYNYAAVAPKVTAGDKTQKSDNLFSNSDWFSWSVNGTGGDKGVNKMGWINYTVTYDGKDLVTYVNGLVDATVQDVDVTLGETVELGGIKGIIAAVRTADVALTQAEVKAAEQETNVDEIDIESIFDKQAVEGIVLDKTENITADMILPTLSSGGKAINWSSSDPSVIDSTGAVTRDAQAHTVVLTAKVGEQTREITVTVAPKADVTENLVFKYNFEETYTDENGVTRIKDASGNGFDGELYGTAANLENGKLDLTANTANAWGTNSYMNVPYDILKGVRSYTVVQQVKNGNATGARLYDFGYEAFHSMFTRANTLSAGIKDDSNGGTKNVAASAQLDSSKEQWVVTSYNAATGVTTITVDGVNVLTTTEIPHQPYNQTNGSAERNFIGRAQWFDTWDQGSGNQDFNGTIDNFMFFNAALTEEEIKELTSASVAAQPALSVKADGSLGLAFIAKVSGNLDLVTEAGFEYGKNTADENGNYVVEPEYTDKKCGEAAEEFRLVINGVSNANSARTYVAKPYVVVAGQKIYGEAVSASLYGQIIDSVINGKGSAITDSRLASANSVIAFVKANRNENSEAKFPLLKAATEKLYNDDGTINAKAAGYGISDAQTLILNDASMFSLEEVEIEFVEEKAGESEIVTDLTIDVDFTQAI